jgi:hypothetical protein
MQWPGRRYISAGLRVQVELKGRLPAYKEKEKPVPPQVVKTSKV